MRRIIVLAVAVVALAACGQAAPRQAAPASNLPADDPARGIYTYEHAKELGLRVPPLPPPDEICPVSVDDGFSAEELDTPEQIAAIDRDMATAPTCQADPRGALVIVGYSVEAVRDAGSAYDKGRLICSASGAGWFFRVPPLGSEDFDAERVLRSKLEHAYGIEPTDDPEQVFRGCADTAAGREFLAQ